MCLISDPSCVSSLYGLKTYWIFPICLLYLLSYLCALCSLTHFDQHLYYSNVLCNHIECLHCLVEIHNILSSVDSSREHDRHRRCSVLFICTAVMELLMSWFKFMVHLTWHHTAGNTSLCIYIQWPLMSGPDKLPSYCDHINPLEGGISHVNSNFLIPSDGRERGIETQLSNSQSWDADHVFLMSSW